MNCPTAAFSTQKNVTGGTAGSLGAETPRIWTSAAASTPDQVTVTPWPRCTVPTAKRLSNLGGAGTAMRVLNAPISLPPGRGPPPGEETVKEPGSRNPLAGPGPDGGSEEDAPIRSLRGFQRIHLKAGESRAVKVAVAVEDVPKEKVEISVGSGQPVGSTPHVKGLL